MTLSDDELMEYYIHTLNQCGLFLLDEEEGWIEYRIFEEFDTGAHTFLHPSNLERLRASGYIDQDTMRKSSELRGKIVSLQENGEWNIQAFRSSPNWPEVLRLCDEIKSSNPVWPHPSNG
ncbi:hypothetical protein [Saccharibacillus endophyticus]|uniref:Uncharacterized protein n=1 Tax=Saccharibacillus endophyticus TaxID=2060666 RepID=A0ABQ2A130_9BACL|nr:hypothetical protein [Saccharibacillus endophyticus]GGH82564.1 hypothetical protein GCM10007362_34070 [Saccharibacillus endophyticus]